MVDKDKKLAFAILGTPEGVQPDDMMDAIDIVLREDSLKSPKTKNESSSTTGCAFHFELYNREVMNVGRFNLWLRYLHFHPIF
jgi:hypothetical protein